MLVIAVGNTEHAQPADAAIGVHAQGTDLVDLDMRVVHRARLRSQAFAPATLPASTAESRRLNPHYLRDGHKAATGLYAMRI